MVSIYKELSYDQDGIETVRGIQFSVLGPEEIKARSVVDVTRPDTYSGNDPVIGGLFDPRMGIIEHNRVCSTCEQKNTFCPGHFGHITLARPVFHPLFFNTVRNLLKCVCFRCSRIMVSTRSNKTEFAEEVKRISAIKNAKKRLDAMLKLCGNTKLKRCGDDQEDNDQNNGCKARQPYRYLKEQSMRIVAEWKDAELPSKEFTAEDILRIFQRITDEDIHLLGFNPKWNKPEYMIMTCMAVPPPCVRPSIIEENGQRREDDLTHKLSDIIKFNNQLKTRIDTGKGNEEQLRVLTNLVQYHIATFMDNQIPGLPVAQQRNGRKLKSITDRLKKKEGRIRGNLNGKRVDQSARSVITPDPNIMLDQLGVPIKIAMTVTFPEVVNKYNIEHMRMLVRNGPDTWPGVKYVRVASDGVTITLKYADKNKIANELRDGDIVDRHLVDEDVVLFNRQPSLHKMSMMAFRVKVMPYQTFRLPVMTTGPFNADFDGDEMNKFVPQSPQTMSELKDLAAVPYLILAPRDAKPIVEIVQDTMVGSFRLTKEWTRINDKVMANLQMVNSYFGRRLPSPTDEKSLVFTGKQALSQILPPGLFIDMKNKTEEKLRIIDSKLVSGTIDKEVFHALSKGIIPTLFHDYGPFETARFIDNMQRLICRWLLTAGFSVGISDLVTDAETSEKLKQTISKYKGTAYAKVQEMRIGKMENKSIFNTEDYFEREMLNVLNELTSQVGKIGLKQIDEKTNRMINMVKSGSKGKETNVAQMIACVGQQNVDGKRVAYGFTDRTLPHFTKYDDGPEARGFVENSFISGLSPQEVFFHAMGGREGLIDTAVRSVTGDTPIFIIEDNKPRYVRIGDWIDAYLDNPANNTDIQKFEERQLELLYINQKEVKTTHISTMDNDGNVMWSELVAVTRHDPGVSLYEITTHGGRSVIVTESKSLLVWDDSRQQFWEKPTTEVNIGDYVPVTASLPDAPVLVSSVDMSEYLPKATYLHGTEYNKAVCMMKDAQGASFHIPRGWWEKHNGTSFTLPYPSKARLMRATERSNNDNILDGCVYPFHAMRERARIPDKFELDYNNGVFIGLFLADGNTDTAAGSIQITKQDPSVQEFVKEWFDKFAITVTQDKKIGTTYGVVGSSTLLVRFLDAFVGHGAHKYVPDIAFVAPKEFVKGIVSGYISGDGTIVRGGIETSSVSARLTEGISLLCNRLGAFGKMSIKDNKSNEHLGSSAITKVHALAIRAQWAQKLSHELNLVSVGKNKQLKELLCTSQHINFTEKNDVVLDKIVDIKILDAKDYPKVYDVTVPATLNFAHWNGLMLYDTSETGYIQRRLVKAMEDCKVYYDQTVRNATGTIVQFLYGEDGIDGTKIERQFINYIDYNMLQMDAKYCLRPDDNFGLYLTKDALKAMKSEDWVKQAKSHFDALVDDRLFLINNVFKGDHSTRIHYAIPFDRITKTAMQRLAVKGVTAVQTDLTPGYILDTIDRLINTLYSGKPNQGTRFLAILLRVHLSPKPLMFDTHMPKDIFDWVVTEIQRYFIESIVHAGEMVGIVAAQSMGEMSTQASVTGETQVHIAGHNSFTGNIGDFIDALLDANKDTVVTVGRNSVVLDLSEDYYVVGISQQEKTSWKRISQVSRHPANGGLVTVTTRSGRKVTATLSHSFLKRNELGITTIKGSDLRVGDRIPVARCVPEITQPLYEVVIGKKCIQLDKQFGWIIGAYIADGSLGTGTVGVSKIEPEFEDMIRSFGAKYDMTVTVKQETRANKAHHLGFKQSAYTTKTTYINNMPLQKWIDHNFGRGSHNKRIGGFVFNTNKEFIAGIVSGYFDGDGNTNVDKQLIRAASVNEKLIDDIALLLAHLNVFTTKGVQSRESRSTMYSLTVSRKYAITFQNIGLNVKAKKEGLDAIVAYNNDLESTKDIVDMIPETGDYIDSITKILQIPEQSRLYGRYKRLGINKIGREALKRYVDLFEAVNNMREQPSSDVDAKLQLLKQAVNSDAVYDEIVQLDYTPDNGGWVYDFSVPGNDSFMVNGGILVHNTLDSFHSSGTAAAVKATSGVPRLKELLSVSKNIKTPTLMIYMKPDISTVVNPVNDDDGETNDPRVQETKENSIRVMRQLEIARMVDILEKSEVYWDPPGPSGLQTSIASDTGMLAVYNAFAEVEKLKTPSTFPWVLRLILNKEKMHDIGLSAVDIYIKLISSYNQNIDCVFSDDNAAEIIFRVRLTQEAMKDIDAGDAVAALKAMEHNIVHNILLKGTKGIKKVSMRTKERKQYNADVDKFDSIKEWVLDTDGTNLQQILANPNVDQQRTRSNDIYEIYQVLGIEAARNALFEEFTEVVGDGAINYRHMSLLLDTMTNKGTLMSIDRHGINRGDVGPLAKSSFEETTDMLINASIFSEQDRINGVSANIMLGQLPPCGTGDHDIIFDEREFMRLLKATATTTVKPDIIEANPSNDLPSKEACSIEVISMKYTPPKKQKSIAMPTPVVTFA